MDSQTETNSVNTVNNNAKVNKLSVPTNYQCFRCKMIGHHWLKNCQSKKQKKQDEQSSPNQDTVYVSTEKMEFANEIKRKEEKWNKMDIELKAQMDDNIELTERLDRLKQNEEVINSELRNERKKNRQLKEQIDDYKLTKIQQIEKNKELVDRCNKLEEERGYNKNVSQFYQQQLINKYDEIEIQTVDQIKTELNDMKQKMIVNEKIYTEKEDLIRKLEMLNNELFKKLKQRNDENKELKQQNEEYENMKLKQSDLKFNGHGIKTTKRDNNDDEKLDEKYINGIKIHHEQSM